MAKEFTPRKSKRERTKYNTNSEIANRIAKMNDDRLLKGAQLSEVELKKIVVKQQVRTKFNDSSLNELGQNIKANGLIQPLVLHEEGNQYVLICGERRFRAMNLIKMEYAPCFIIRNKTEEELMAIQFSENSAREELHYIDKADGIYNYQIATKSSERKIQKDLGISKSDVHRSLLIAKLSGKLKDAAKAHNIEKYVLLEFDALDKRNPLRKELEKDILNGKITKRSQLKRRFMKSNVVKTNSKVKEKIKKLKKDDPDAKKNKDLEISAKAFIKAMNGQTKKLKMDKKTKELMKKLIQETSQVVQN